MEKDKVINDLLERIANLEREVERLNNRLKTSNDTCNYLRNTIDKAIEYIESYINQFNGVYPPADMRYLDLHKLLEILKGSDKE